MFDESTTPPFGVGTLFEFEGISGMTTDHRSLDGQVGLIIRIEAVTPFGDVRVSTGRRSTGSGGDTIQFYEGAGGVIKISDALALIDRGIWLPTRL